jgi:hypothetical protein
MIVTMIHLAESKSIDTRVNGIRQVRIDEIRSGDIVQLNLCMCASWTHEDIYSPFVPLKINVLLFRRYGMNEKWANASIKYLYQCTTMRNA